MKKIDATVSYVLLSIVTLIILIPFLWMLSTALKTNQQTFIFPPEWIPRPFTLENFIRVWGELPFVTYIKNTVFVTGVVLLGQLVIGSMAAFGFARLKFPGRDLIFVIFLGSLMIPEIVTMIPLYILMDYLGWLDTFKAIIAPQLFNTAFVVFLLRQYFQGIPTELDDAAKIDGAGIIRRFISIILPISKPALSTAAIFILVKTWNQFLWPLVVTSSENKFVLSIGMANLQGQYTADWSGIMSSALISLLPMLVIFAFAQKYFVQSIQMSGIK